MFLLPIEKVRLSILSLDLGRERCWDTSDLSLRVLGYQNNRKLTKSDSCWTEMES